MTAAEVSDAFTDRGPYRSRITVTLVVGIREEDVRTNDLDAMTNVTEFVADQVERFFPHFEVLMTEGSVAS